LYCVYVGEPGGVRFISKVTGVERGSEWISLLTEKVMSNYATHKTKLSVLALLFIPLQRVLWFQSEVCKAVKETFPTP